MRLSDEDGRAVDMLLDRPATKGNGNGNGASNDGTTVSFSTMSATNGQAQVRIDAATDVLHLLDNLEAPEPPADLVQRTLRKIDEMIEAGRARVPAGATVAPVARQQPQA